MPVLMKHSTESVTSSYVKGGVLVWSRSYWYSLIREILPAGLRRQCYQVLTRAWVN